MKNLPFYPSSSALVVTKVTRTAGMNLTGSELGLGDMEVTTTTTTEAMATTAYPCDSASDEEMAFYGECAYWLDGIGQVREPRTVSSDWMKRDSQKATGQISRSLDVFDFRS